MLVFIVALAVTGASKATDTESHDDVLSTEPPADPIKIIHPNKCFDCERDDIAHGFPKYTQKSKCLSCEK